jgi:hypothetical protein
VRRYFEEPSDDTHLSSSGVVGRTLRREIQFEPKRTVIIEKRQERFDEVIDEDRSNKDEKRVRSDGVIRNRSPIVRKERGEIEYESSSGGRNERVRFEQDRPRTGRVGGRTEDRSRGYELSGSPEYENNDVTYPREERSRRVNRATGTHFAGNATIFFHLIMC